MSALFDVPSLIVVLLLIICSSSYLRSLYPTIFNDGSTTKRYSLLLLYYYCYYHCYHCSYRSGFKGALWKASRLGERMSQYIG